MIAGIRHRATSSRRLRRVIFQEPIFKHLGTTVRTPLDTKTAPSARVTDVYIGGGQGTRPRTPSNDGNYNTPSFRRRRAASWADLERFETRSSGVGGAGKERIPPSPNLATSRYARTDRSTRARTRPVPRRPPVAERRQGSRSPCARPLTLVAES
ncbi:unnamed protein product [Rangifer tarandus platyrhynchus]|uniref:Uncharacterized protein n=1 Tax=Rangifer tarandus platyrhynchus TaxID=3082113 RepID=A0ABN8ZE62_RANTA|nr:unnamed protein product [Rangifer tarandus platyrhynchus]CAI9688548.1 unnamed protein product [Rangifer tarandus platyrhynchus]